MTKKPMFQRRHYRAISEVLAHEYRKPSPGSNPNWLKGYNGGLVDEWNNIVHAFVILFTYDNPNFDRERFLTWCYQS
jgi:hypothetical protein